MLNDVRYALRTFARAPGFALAAIATLALGVGLNSAVFAIFNAVLFKPPPVETPHRLVRIAYSATSPTGPRFGTLTYPDFLRIRERPDLFAGAFAYAPAPMSVSAGGQATRVAGQIASGTIFETLGVRMPLGRGFRAEEDSTPSGHPVAVIGHGLWRRMFASDPAIVGASVTLNGHPFTIIGVAPEGFIGPDALEPAEAWVPLMMHEAAAPEVSRPLGPESWWLRCVARLAPEVSITRAGLELSALAAALRQSDPTLHKDFGLRTVPFHPSGPEDRAQVFPVFALVLAFTLTVLLVACANVAGLLLSRSAGRRREIGIRLAVGATRFALARQWLVESLILSACGGAAGLLVSLWGTDALARLIRFPVPLETTPDGRALVFACAISLGSGIAFGLGPALRASRHDVLRSIRGESGSSTHAGSSRLQRLLVVGQFAVSLVLLAAAGLLLRGLSQAWNADVGFSYQNRVAVSMDLRLQRYTPERAAAFYRTVLEEVRGLPGVDHATAAHLVPFGGRVYVHELSFPGRPHDRDAMPERASVNRVWTDFFSTLEIPLIEGRAISVRDIKPVPDVAVVSETMARRYWPDGNAVGQRFSVDGPDGPFVRVIGIARDVRIDEFTERPWPAVYLPHDTRPGEAVVIAASSRPAAQTIREIEGVVRRLDRDLALYASRPLSAYVAERMDGERALSQMLGICGTMALSLAALGLYGVMAYGVACRTREIGVRVALGANVRAVRWLFVREAMRLAALGLAWGIAPAIGITFLMRSMVVGVGVADPYTLAPAAALLVGGAVLASYLPARRATRIEPLEALRVE